LDPFGDCSENTKKQSTTGAILGIAFGIILLILFFGGFCYLKKKTTKMISNMNPFRRKSTSNKPKRSFSMRSKGSVVPSPVISQNTVYYAMPIPHPYAMLYPPTPTIDQDTLSPHDFSTSIIEEYARHFDDTSKRPKKWAKEYKKPDPAETSTGTITNMTPENNV
jgi:hypothetical protein